MKKRLLSLLLLTAMLVCMSAFAATVSLAGAHDSIATAVPIVLGNKVAGSITDTDKKAYYAVFLPSSGTLSIVFKSAMNSYAYIYDENGNELKHYSVSVNNAGQGNLTEDVCLTKGDYYFVVSENWGTRGAYEFTLSLTSANVSFEENNGGSNNEIANANGIDFGTKYKGLIAANDVADCFSFALPSSGTLGIVFKSAMNSYAYIYDENGKELKYYSVSVNNAGQGNLTEDVCLTKGEYYFVVRENWGTRGAYEFTLSFTSANVSFEETNGGLNNEIANANGIDFGTKYKGLIAANDVADCFSFALPSSGTVGIVLNSAMNARVHIYDENGAELKYYGVDVNGAGQGHLEENLSLSEGSYYFVVRDGYWGTRGTYEFTIYDSSISEHPDDPSDGKDGFLPGDVNADGKINAKDVTAIMKHLVGSTPKVFIKEAADFNSDTKINAKDVTALMKFIVSGK